MEPVPDSLESDSPQIGVAPRDRGEYALGRLLGGGRGGRSDNFRVRHRHEQGEGKPRRHKASVDGLADGVVERGKDAATGRHPQGTATTGGRCIAYPCGDRLVDRLRGPAISRGEQGVGTGEPGIDHGIGDRPRLNLCRGERGGRIHCGDPAKRGSRCCCELRVAGEKGRQRLHARGVTPVGERRDHADDEVAADVAERLPQGIARRRSRDPLQREPGHV